MAKKKEITNEDLLKKIQELQKQIEEQNKKVVVPYIPYYPMPYPVIVQPCPLPHYPQPIYPVYPVYPVMPIPSYPYYTVSDLPLTLTSTSAQSYT